jgi:hypothetical protein
MIFDKKVIIVDDFYPDPHAVRKTALEAEYEDDPNLHNYPGKNTTTPYWNEQLNTLLNDIVGEKVCPEPTSSCGHFRYVTATDTSSQLIHFDPKPAQIWAGVSYLSLPEHYVVNDTKLDSGTKIYSHKRTGMDRAPADHIEGAILGVRTVDDMVHFFKTEGLNKSLWNVELNVDIKFNRLVLFRPWLWHAMADHFGTNRYNSRLTQLFFLRKA